MPAKATAAAPRPKQEIIHPFILEQLAAEHVKDMQAAATRGRRVREARRARRGVIALTAAGRPLSQAPSSQTPCPELTARAA